jgi:hypothetical protein
MSLSRILNDQPLARPAATESASDAPSPRPTSRNSTSSTHVPEEEENGQSSVRWLHYDPHNALQRRQSATLETGVASADANADATAEPTTTANPIPTITVPPASRGKNGHASSENGTGGRRKRKTAEPNGKEEPTERRVRTLSGSLVTVTYECSHQYALRRRPPKNKQYQPDSPTPTGTPEPPHHAELQPTEDELRFTSSDLEDTEEIWKPELEAYILDSHRRQKYVGNWFAANYHVSVSGSL